MNPRQSLQLKLNQPQALVTRRPLNLAVERGTVWLTVSGGEDVFLSQGQSYRLSVGGKAVIEALRGDASVSIAPFSRFPLWRAVKRMAIGKMTAHNVSVHISLPGSI